MREDKIEPALTAATFAVMKAATSLSNRLSLPVISTGRSFAYYRKIFFANASASSVLSSLRGKTIVDIGCGLTPYVSNSMFQACQAVGVPFYGVDPKLARGFRLGTFDRLKVWATGGARLDPDAPGMDKAIGTLADDLPFADASVDVILSCYAMYAWIDDEAILDGIFREFHRVLKTGGSVRIFPTQKMDVERIAHAGLRDILSQFSIEQTFAADWLRLGQYPPAYMTTFSK